MNRVIIACVGIMLAMLGSGTASAQHAALEHAPRSGQISCQTDFPITTQDCNGSYYVWEFATTHNNAAPPNYAGNKPYLNSDGKLPPPKGIYLTYDIYQRPPPGTARGPQRIVIDTGEGTFAYFTPDHYTNFTVIKFFGGSSQSTAGALWRASAP